MEVNKKCSRYFACIFLNFRTGYSSKPNACYLSATLNYSVSST